MSAHISDLLQKYKNGENAPIENDTVNDLVFSLDLDESIKSIK